MIPARMLLQDEQSTQSHQAELQESEKIVAAGVYAKPVNYETKQTVHVEVERPNIFVLYEQNIGLLSPLIAEELKDASDHFPKEWIEDAFREAVDHNKRKWSYIRAILRRWETEGRQ
jgi:DnaD/phage-associated family protein